MVMVMTTPSRQPAREVGGEPSDVSVTSEEIWMMKMMTMRRRRMIISPLVSALSIQFRIWIRSSEIHFEEEKEEIICQENVQDFSSG